MSMDPPAHLCGLRISFMALQSHCTTLSPCCCKWLVHIWPSRPKSTQATRPALAQFQSTQCTAMSWTVPPRMLWHSTIPRVESKAQFYLCKYPTISIPADCYARKAFKFLCASLVSPWTSWRTAPIAVIKSARRRGLRTQHRQLTLPGPAELTSCCVPLRLDSAALLQCLRWSHGHG